MPGSGNWASGRGEADTDLTRVHAFAAWCVRQCDTCDEFQRRLNRLSVDQLAARLPSRDGWSEACLEWADESLQNT